MKISILGKSTKMNFKISSRLFIVSVIVCSMAMLLSAVNVSPGEHMFSYEKVTKQRLSSFVRAFRNTYMLFSKEVFEDNFYIKVSVI